MKKFCLLALAVGLVVAVSSDLYATTVTVDLGTILGTPTGGTSYWVTNYGVSSPYLRATFTDNSLPAGTVRLTMTATGIGTNTRVSAGAAANYQTWFFNVADAYVNTLSFSNFVNSGIVDTDYSVLQHFPGNYFQADNDGKYDWAFAFWNASMFTQGDSLTVDITSSVAGLDATDFDLQSLNVGGTGAYVSAAKILAPNPSGEFTMWVAGNGNSNSAVPEPATMLVLGSGLIGLAGLARRKFSNK